MFVLPFHSFLPSFPHDSFLVLHSTPSTPIFLPSITSFHLHRLGFLPFFPPAGMTLFSQSFLAASPRIARRTSPAQSSREEGRTVQRGERGQDGDDSDCSCEFFCMCVCVFFYPMVVLMFFSYFRMC